MDQNYLEQLEKAEFCVLVNEVLSIKKQLELVYLPEVSKEELVKNLVDLAIQARRDGIGSIVSQSWFGFF